MTRVQVTARLRGAIADLRDAGILGVIAAAVAVVTVAAVVWCLLFTRVAEWNSGCADDGIRYCAMAIGHLTGIPTSRRVLFPALLRVLHPPNPALGDGANYDGLPALARGLNLAFLAGICLEVALLTRRACDVLGVPRPRRTAVQIIAVGLILLEPFGFRWTYFYPVLTDPLAIFLGLGWLLLATSQGRARWLAIPVALLAGVTREEWLVLIMVGSVTQLLMERSRRQLVLTGLTAAALLIAAEIVFRAPSDGDDYKGDFIGFARHIVFDYFIGDSKGRQVLAWSILFALGLLPLLVLTLTRGAGRLFLAEVRQRSGLFPAALAMTLLVLASAPLGFDLHRNLSLVIPILLPFALAVAATNRRADLELAAILVGTILVWRPFHTLDGTKDAYLNFWELFAVDTNVVVDRLAADIRFVVVPLLLWAGAVVVRSVRASLRQRSAHL